MSIAEEELGRVLDGIETSFGHAKHANFVDGPEAVLGCAQHSMVEGGLALEIEHRVDDVLERLRSRDPAGFSDVPNDEDRRSTRLREAHQARGTLAHLTDIARTSPEIGRENRLNRIDDQFRR